MCTLLLSHSICCPSLIPIRPLSIFPSLLSSLASLLSCLSSSIILLFFSSLYLSCLFSISTLHLLLPLSAPFNHLSSFLIYPLSSLVQSPPSLLYFPLLSFPSFSSPHITTLVSILFPISNSSSLPVLPFSFFPSFLSCLASVSSPLFSSVILFSPLFLARLVLCCLVLFPFSLFPFLPSLLPCLVSVLSPLFSSVTFSTLVFLPC